MPSETTSLESLCELIVDCPHSTPKWTSQGIVVLRNQNIKGGTLDLSSPSYTDEEGYQKRIKRAQPQAGDIIFTREAPMGEVCMIPEGLKCCLGQRQVLLRPKEGVSGDYLFWALQSPYVQHQISWNEGTGTTVSNVRIPVLKSLQIPRHLGEEEKIGRLLNSFASKIKSNYEINNTLEKIVQALFKSWFVDFEPVKAKMVALESGGTAEEVKMAAMQAISGKSATELDTLKTHYPDQYDNLVQTAELFPSAMVESQLGEIPEGWDVGSVSDVATLEIRSVKPANAPDEVWEHYSIPAYDDGQYPTFDLGKEIKSNKYQVPDSAILVSKLNPRFPRKWWPLVIDSGLSICSTEFMPFVSVEEGWRGFVAGLVLSEPFQRGMLERVSGSTGSRQRAQPREVKKMPVILPDRDLIEAFSKRVTPLFEKSAQNIPLCQPSCPDGDFA